MFIDFYIENVKCQGCKNTIIKELKMQDGIKYADVDIETGLLKLEYEGGEETLLRVKSKLRRKGYPEKGKKTIKTTAQSYLSCAMGRMSEPAKFEIPTINFDPHQ